MKKWIVLGFAVLTAAIVIAGFSISDASNNLEAVSADQPRLDPPPGQIGEEILGFTNCLWGDAVEAYENPENEEECIATFGVRHRVCDEEDPDCCEHEAPGSVKLHYRRKGTDWGSADAYPSAWSEGDGCYFCEYTKTLTLTKGESYDYYFDSCGTSCRCPPLGNAEIDPVDCEPE